MIFWMSVTAIGIDARERFVEQDELRRDDERARDFDPAALPARERIRGRLGEGGQPELGQQLPPPCGPGGAVQLKRFENRRDVLLDRQAAENGRLLRKVADAFPGPHVHRVVRHIRAVEQHPPRIGGRQADHHGKRGGLARPVGPEQPDDFSGCDVEVHASDDGSAAVGFGEVARVERGHSGPAIESGPGPPARVLCARGLTPGTRSASAPGD